MHAQRVSTLALACFVLATPAAGITVTSIADSGPGSLREAVELADSDGAPTIITFDLGLVGQKILLSEGLQLFEGQTTIDGDVDGDCVPDVEISGELLGEGWHGLDVGSSGNVIRGLAITHFPGSGIQLSNAWDNVVECSFFGVDLAGEAAGNQNEGIQLNHDASRNRIGPGNVIAHNGQGLAVRDGWTEDYPSFAGVTPDASGVYPTIDFTDDCGGYFRYADGEPVLDGEGRPFRDAIGARFTAVLTVDAPGDFLFEIEELADHALLTIDGATVLDEECCGYYSTTVSLVPGAHALELAFQDGGTARVKLEISGPGNASLSTGGSPGVLAELFKMRVPSEGNTITQTSFYANDSGQAIGFGFCGYVQNDPGDLDDGPNTLLNHPDLTGGEDLGGGLYRVSGTATPSSTIEFYAAEPEPNGPGGGQEYLASVTADPSGDFTAEVTLPVGPPGGGQTERSYSVTATATDGGGNTSQFSSYLGLAPREISVDSLADGGPGSLRDAIDQANGDGGPTIITFDPSLAGQTIVLQEQLPDLWDDGTTIDGDLDGDCSPDIEIDGSLLGSDGILVASSGNVIRGLGVKNFEADGINITAEFGNTADDNVVECNELSGNRIGISVGYGAQDNRIGPGNLVHGNNREGVSLPEWSPNVFPEFAGLTADGTGVFTEIDFTGDCTAFRHAGSVTPTDSGGGTFDDNFGARFTGTLSILAGGDYEIVLRHPDDQVRVQIDGATVLDVSCCDDFSAIVSLSAGDHAFELDFMQHGGPGHLELEILGGETTFSHGGAPGLFAEFFHTRTPTERNTITRNSIFDNGGPGIVLGGCELRPNDPGDADVGSNTLLNHPELLAFADLGGGDFLLQGTATPESLVEIFAAVPDESGHGEGKEFLDSVTAGVAGDFSGSITLPPEYLSVTATATDPAGNTSTFSRNLGLRTHEISVNHTADGGPGSLREALEQAESDGAPSVITFDPSLAGQTIVLQEPLPELRDGSTTIDGDFGGDCLPDVALSGELLPDAAGLEVRSSNNVIRGLAIHSFSWAAIQIWGPYSRADGNIVECNHLGTGFTATEVLGNGDAGVRLTGGGSDNLIARNVIAHNGTEGVLVLEEPGDARFPAFDGYPVETAGVYPLIDFDTTFDCGPFESAGGIRPVKADGTFFYGNFGLRLNGTLSVDAGDDYEFRLDYAARQIRVWLDGEEILGGWCCGDQLSAIVPLEAGSHELLIAVEFREPESRLRLEVEGLSGGSATLSSGGEPGLYAEFFDVRNVSEGNTISRNSIFDNGGLGIDLDWCWVQPNDPGDVDVGANTVLNHPVLTGFAELAGDAFEITGTATPESTVELFAVAKDLDTRRGEGKEYLGTVTAGLSGDFTATVVLPAGYTSVTATTTDAAGNTSEYARNLRLRSNQLTVESLADEGPGSLRDALEQADHDGGPTIITFDPSLAGGRIVLQDGLPSLHEGGTTIDGDIDGDCVPDIELDGSGFAHGNSFSIHSDGNRIAGFAIHSFPGPGQGGDLLIEGGGHNTIECNYIGTDFSRTAPLGGAFGIKITEGASDNLIRRNLIAFNHLDGIGVFDGFVQAFPDFAGLTPDPVLTAPVIDFTDEGGSLPFQAPGLVLTDSNGGTFYDTFGARFTGTVNVSQNGDYTLDLEHDDGARLILGGAVLIDLPDCCGGSSATTHLEAGSHPIEIDYFEGGGHARLRLEISGPGSATLTTDGNAAGCTPGGSGLCAELFQLRVPSDRNTITENSIHSNSGLGIQLGDLVPGNDSEDADIGPNTLLNWPELESFTELGGIDFSVSGSALPESTVELFAAAPDERGYGEGEFHLGSVMAGPSGDFVTIVSLPAEYTVITATATDPAGNTSAFSRNLGLRANEISVTSVDAQGPGSLRDAIDQANGDGGPTIITFDPSLAGQRIVVQDGLPNLREDATTIDGDLDGDCVPDIEISSDGSGWNALRIESSDNLVRGLIVNGFPGPGIEITSGWQPANDNVVECNFVGTDASGTVAIGNGDGVYVAGSGNRIGGPWPGARNLISGNHWTGVALTEGAGGNVVEGNLIGVDVSGTAPLGNGSDGVYIGGGDGNRVGPDNVIAFSQWSPGIGVANEIDWRYPDFEGSAADATGVFPAIDFAGDCDTPFESAGGIVPADGDGEPFIDHFGALFTGTLSLSEGGDVTFELREPDDTAAVIVDGETVLDVWCCGDYAETVHLDAGDHEIRVAYLQFDGNAHLELAVSGPGAIALSTDGARGDCAPGQAGLCGELFQLQLAPEGNTLTGNSIFDNSGLGIDLYGCWWQGVSENDPGDGDVGPNQLMNFPELTQALAGAGGTTIEGILDTPSPELATVELFAGSAADPSGYGEGETYLTSVAPDAAGAFSIVVSELAAGDVVTATATDAAGNTSEFSLALRVSEPVRWATALYAAADSATSVSLTWTDPQMGETGFRVERSGDRETWFQVAIASGDATRHLDFGLAPATLYYYRVIATAGGIDERASNLAWATTFPASAAKVCHQQVTTMHRGARLPSPAWNGANWAVAWMERDGAHDELYFQLLDPGGTPLGTPRRLTESDSITQLPTLRWNGESFGLIYGEHMRGPAGQFWSSTKFARLAADGTPIRKEVLLDAGLLGGIPNQFDEALVWDGTHWGWFALKAYDFPESEAFEVGFYRLSEDGEIVQGPVRLTDTPESEQDVAVAWNGSEYGVTWTDGAAVSFLRVSADGTVIGAPVLAAQTAGAGVWGTHVLWDGEHWAVAWSETVPEDGSEPVMLRFYEVDGSPMGNAERISDDYDQEFGPGMPVYDEYPQLVAKPGGYALYTLSYSIATGGWEMARLEADAAGGRVGQRQFVSDRDGLHSLWNRVATDGSHDLIAYNEHRQGSQEIAAVVVGPTGNVTSGPVDLTSGHDPGVSTAWTVGSFDPRVVRLGGGFAALWRDLLDGGQIHARIWDGSGAQVANPAPLTTGGVAGGPVAVGVGDSFAAAWLDGDSGQIVFDRYDAAGNSLLGEVQLDDGGVPEALAFSGEVYGVAWRQGSGIALQAVTPDGEAAGPPATILGAGNRLIRVQWTGAGWAIVARAGSDLAYALVDVGGAFLVPPVTITGTPAIPRALEILWAGEHLGVAWSEDRDFDGERQVFFTVLDLAGGKAFDEVELWHEGRGPTLYWQSGSFHVVFRSLEIEAGGNRQVDVQPDGTVLGSRTLSAHLGLGHAAGNGVTAGFLYGHRAEMYFETTACLDDATPPPAPELSALYDGFKVVLVWTEVGDPESTVLGYNLYRDGELIAESFATTFSYADPGVVAGAVYVYELRAMNGAFLESAGVGGIVTVATAVTVEEVGEAMETAATAAFEQAIEDILADPGVPDAAADEVQDALDDVIGNNGGRAKNGAVDKLAKGKIVPALVKMRHAVEELQDAAAAGYDTGDLQLLVTSYARLAVLAVIQINAEAHGEGAVVAARALFDQAGVLLAAGDYLAAIDVYEDAVKALP